MVSNPSNETRIKIMSSAIELFGRFGYEGTSIRSIAAHCKVNVAAVNYHFQSKENLFWEIMAASYMDLDQKIREFAATSDNVQKLAMRTFEHFLEERFALRNTMKMILTEGVHPPGDEKIMAILTNSMGPPGGLTFAEMLKKEIPYPLSREGTLWGVKAIFGTVIHWATMCASEPMCTKSKADPLMSPEQITKDVGRMVQASVTYLKENPALFREHLLTF